MRQNPNNTEWVSGDWNAICDRCGFQYKASELKLDWRGLRVCEKDFETRHPQDFVRPRPEKIAVDWARPDEGDAVTVNTVDTILPASQTLTLYYFDTTSGILTATLPNANNAAFTLVETVYSIYNQAGPNFIIASSSSSIYGSSNTPTIVRVGTVGYFKAIPSTNQWLRL